MRPAPRWSIADALNWKGDSKRANTLIPIPIPNRDLHTLLVDRDNVFLIDDSESMRKYWESLEVFKVFEALSYIVKKVDPNGLDLYFTTSKKCKTNSKHTTPMLDMLRSHRHFGTSTDMNYNLTNILEDYQRKLDKAASTSSLLRKPVRPLSLYILTDGVWESNCMPDVPIRNLGLKLEELKKSRAQVGIQFISFGNNPTGQKRMDDLDDGLGLDPDIVDHTRSSGNVWKMLLGSIDASLDARDNNRDIVSPQMYP